MVDSQKIIKFARDKLRNKLNDPLSRDTSWIHDDVPRLDAQYPRVYFQEVDSSNTEFRHVNSTKKRIILLFDCIVRIDSNQETSYGNSVETLGQVEEDVIDILTRRQTQQDLQDELGSIYITYSGTNYENNQSSEGFIQKNISLEVYTKKG